MENTWPQACWFCTSGGSCKLRKADPVPTARTGPGRILVVRLIGDQSCVQEKMTLDAAEALNCAWPAGKAANCKRLLLYFFFQLLSVEREGRNDCFDLTPFFLPFKQKKQNQTTISRDMKLPKLRITSKQQRQMI